MSARTTGGTARAGAAPRAREAAPAILLLALYLVSQYGYALRLPFINDDYIFLDLTRSASFLSLWVPHEGWVGMWYRPWSREVHYWLFQHLFGARVEFLHAASFALWLGLLGAYLGLLWKVADRRVAVVGAAGVAALAAWGLPLTWVAGVQDLWMMLFALLSLHAFVRGRRLHAALALALALLSKETAALLPGIAFAWALLAERRGPRRALAESAPLWGVTLAWALIHPSLGGRLFGAPGAAVPAAAGAAPAVVALRTLLSLVNLDRLPRPEYGWAGPLLLAVPGALLLALLAAWGLRGRREEHGRGTAIAPPRGVALFGIAWAALGWAPLLMPGLGWHAYYALFGALGAWLAGAVALARRPRLALALVVALALLRPARAATVSRDWGDEWYQRRAAEFLSFMRRDLQRIQPAPPRHARFWFSDVPSNVGFLTGDAPSLRIWYADPTLSGGFLSDFRARPPGAPPGRDFFFRYDSTAGWIEIARGPEDVAVARARDPRWRADHERLAVTLSRGGDWEGTAGEYGKLAEAFPADPTYAYYAGLACLAGGDTLGAGRWLRRAAALPEADEEIRTAALDFERHVRPPGQSAPR